MCKRKYTVSAARVNVILVRVASKRNTINFFSGKRRWEKSHSVERQAATAEESVEEGRTRRLQEKSSHTHRTENNKLKTSEKEKKWAKMRHSSWNEAWHKNLHVFVKLRHNTPLPYHLVCCCCRRFLSCFSEAFHTFFLPVFH